MKKYVLRSMVRAILDQPKVPKRYQSAINAKILKRVTEAQGPRRKNKTKTPEERFWRRIEKRDSCWLWRGRSMNITSAPEVVIHPRRFAIEHFTDVGVPAGKIIYPTCGHENCVNPEHQSLRRAGLSRLSAEQVAAIKADPRPFPQIARDYDICRSYVSQIRSGKRNPSDADPIIEFRLRSREHALPAPPPPNN
ncbi:MAG TPA: hypothetical protein VGH38_26040 [Bryobacteraceae bacterium]|jgi:hypothetical protein